MGRLFARTPSPASPFFDYLPVTATGPDRRELTFGMARRLQMELPNFRQPPSKWSKRRRGWASPFKIAEGAGSARPPTHAGAIRGRSGDRRGRDDRRQHGEGSGRGKRLACEERAARVDRRGLATAPRTTSARAEARCLRLRNEARSRQADSVPQRSIAGRPGGLRFGDSLSAWINLATPRRHRAR